MQGDHRPQQGFAQHELIYAAPGGVEGEGTKLLTHGEVLSAAPEAELLQVMELHCSALQHLERCCLHKPGPASSRACSNPPAAGAASCCLQEGQAGRSRTQPRSMALPHAMGLGTRQCREAGGTHLGSTSDGDGACQQVPNDILQGHVQPVHVDGVDQAQAVLQREAQRG